MPTYSRDLPTKETALSDPISQPDPYPSDVQIVESCGRTFLLVGTAHISQESAELVRQVISREQPDCVCVELDAQRFAALSAGTRWEDLDLKEVIRKRQLSPLLANLILSSYQKRLGGQLGVTPGTELLEATKAADEQEIPVTLCDRAVRVTMLRAWRSTSFVRKFWLLSVLISSMFDTTRISEEDLRDIRKKDVLSELLQELGAMFPALHKVLIDERDLYLAEKMRRCEGDRVVGVVGTAHVSGIVRALQNSSPVDLDELDSVPKALPIGKWLGWAIPALIVAAIAAVGWRHGAAAMGDSLLYWILVNAIPCAVGATLALAHPLTILAGLVAAPLTSLTPVIGAGYVTAFVQAYIAPPLVHELQTIAEDMRVPGNWWRNRLLRIFLAFILPTLGSLVGTYVGGYGILTDLF